MTTAGRAWHTPRRAVDLDRSWMTRAACAGANTDLWFPEDASRLEAQAICAECPVRRECLDYAIDAGENYGIWGGETERSRRLIRKRRREGRQ